MELLNDEENQIIALVEPQTEEITAQIEFNDFFKNSDPDIQNWNFNDMYVRSNSPMASNCNSDVETDNQDESGKDKFVSPSHFVRKIIQRNNKDPISLSDTNYDFNPIRKYKKFTYEDIEKSLSQYYDKNEKSFTEVDLLITYLSGMRSVYAISRNITQFKSYSVSMSTISITICLAVIAPIIKELYWSAYFISIGNAIATLLIFLSRYLKFDSNSAQYAFMAKQFNKLENRVEIENTRDDPSSQRMRDIETTLIEMNEYIQELIPEEAVQLFPLIYRTNIMQFIKKTELYRKNLIIRFRDIKNEIHYILFKWNSVGEDIDKIDTNFQSKTPQQEREKNRILYLMSIKEKTKKELMQFKNIYIQINDLFKKEIRYAETHQSCFGCSSVFKPDYDVDKLHPIVRDYLKLVMPD